MSRYFVQLSYKGTRYAGWQRQSGDLSIQELIEEKLSLVLRQKIEITGCGRTDSGVHAENYIAHFDADTNPLEQLRRINKFLPEDIAIHNIWEVPADAHARFNAVSRSYRYEITSVKNPFRSQLSWYLPEAELLNLEAMQEVAMALLKYESFAPFCKTHGSAKTMHCQLSRAEWIKSGQNLQFHVSSNRFLRGMVRLIVGMCIYVGQNKMSKDQVVHCMKMQTPLPQPLSAPAHGLYLCDIVYPEHLQPPVK